jgi:hypothetical protein
MKFFLYLSIKKTMGTVLKCLQCVAPGGIGPKIRSSSHCLFSLSSRFSRVSGLTIFSLNKNERDMPNAPVLCSRPATA